MPVKKRRSKAKAHRITRAAVEAFMAGDKHATDRALGIRPWWPTLEETKYACSYPAGSDAAAEFEMVKGIRLALEAAAKQQKTKAK